MLSWFIRKQEKTTKMIKNKEDKVESNIFEMNKCFENYYKDLYKTNNKPSMNIFNKIKLNMLRRDERQPRCRYYRKCNTVITAI